ncbi:MAG: TonB-dependent receptor [Bryobacterales bacterium]|nr:TonB-dependent receptor [Bryobacterales bacterium]
MSTRSLALLLLGPAALIHAQGTGTIHGTITDATGASVPNARVVALLDERGTTRELTTEANGDFVFPSLAIGTYTITVEAGGFKTLRRTGVTLTTEQNVRVDMRLDVGNVSESVSVSAEAPLVDSRSSVIGTLIDSRRVTDLPLNGRNIIGLAALLPGATGVSAPQTFTGDRSGPTLNVSGSRANQNLFLFDGQQFNAAFRNTGLNYPPPDALQEVKVLTNSFSAEYGRNAGAVFQVVTRSGTNEIHGAAWEFLRNHKLNARSFFAPSTIPQLIQNQFGVAVGGPVKKDKLFLFGSYEGLRVRPASLGASAFPLTEAERRGDFSSATAPIRDPANNNQPFPGNQIPTARFDTVARNLLNPAQMPLPNRGDQLITTFPTPANNGQYLFRADWNFRRHVVDGRYNLNRSYDRSSAGSVPAYLPLDRNAKVNSITIGDTWSLTATLLNQARISFNRFSSDYRNLNPTHLSDLGGIFPQFGPKIPPTIDITGRLTLGNASSVDAIAVNESLQLNDSVTWTRRRHTLKGGFEILKLRYLNRSFFQTMGSFTFNGQITGNAAADFVLGRATSMTVASPVLEQAGLQNNVYLFVQDDWRVHPRLTLNLGLRYELPFNWVHPADWWGTFHQGKQSTVIPNAPVGMVFPGDPGVPRGLFPTDKNNFAPRIGFSWDPFGNGRTAIRGAYGFFYDTINSDVIQNTSQPYRYTFTIPTPFSLTDPLRGQPAIPLTIELTNPRFVGLQEIFYPDPALRSPYIQQFNFNIQREVVKDFVVQAAYVGKLGRKLLMGVSTNPALFGPGATVGNINNRRLVPGFGNLQNISSRANSTYHALQIEATKRMSRGFSIQGAYTYAKSLDQASAIALGAAVPNVFNLRSQWGRSDFDARQVAALSWIWDLPKFGGAPTAVRLIAGGWQVNGMLTARTGQPLNILTGQDNALSSTPNQRPNLIGNPVLPSDRPRSALVQAWFDRTAFANPAAGTYGNFGRNVIDAPPNFGLNAGVFKSFPIPLREGMRFEFRTELFSLTNTPNFSNPNTSLSAGANMGRITGAGGARVVQFAGKIVF